jgi:hypothetical protein
VLSAGRQANKQTVNYVERTKDAAARRRVRISVQLAAILTYGQSNFQYNLYFNGYDNGALIDHC